MSKFLKSSFFFNFIFIFIYFWLCWVFVSVRGLSLVAPSRGQSSSQCAGLSLSWPLLMRSTGSRRAGSVVVAHGPSCSAACGIFPDQGSNPCPLHWQADSQPLRHQGSPKFFLKIGLLLFYLFIYFWLRQVLVEECGIFLEACGIFRCSAWASLQLWRAGFLFSSCSARAPGRVDSVVVACGLQSTWAL